MEIYLDNFKGFHKTFIDLDYDITFLVGENSSGKTSLLKLIRLISDYRFWYYNDFNIEDLELGYFNEIVTKSSPSKNHFFIGVLFDDKVGYLLKFKDRDGFPALSEFSFFNSDVNFHFKVMPQEILYKYHKHTKEKLGEINQFYKRWIKDNGLANVQTFKYKVVSHSRLILTTLDGILREISMKEEDKINLGLFSILDISLYKKITWMGPIRAEPKRTYDNYSANFSSQGEHIPYILKKILNNKNKENKKFIENIERFGIESGLFEKIEVKNLGEDKVSPFEINISFNGGSYRISNVGYGISQILPILIEILNNTNSTFAIQQPEVHLHPKAQAAFGEFIYNSQKNNKCKFYIETHSDYIIDRFRYCMHLDKTKRKKANARVLFFNRTKSGNEIYQIKIDSNGSYSENKATMFREFFIKEELKIISI